MDDEIAKSLEESSNAFNKICEEWEKEQEEYWNSLTKEEQLKVFCAVSRRIYEGEILEQGSYRYVLYNTFGFGPEAYAPAQVAGYLSIHNAIFDAEHERDLLVAFAKSQGLGEESVDDFYSKGNRI